MKTVIGSARFLTVGFACVGEEFADLMPNGPAFAYVPWSRSMLASASQKVCNHLEDQMLF